MTHVLLLVARIKTTPYKQFAVVVLPVAPLGIVPRTRSRFMSDALERGQRVSRIKNKHDEHPEKRKFCRSNNVCIAAFKNDTLVPKDIYPHFDSQFAGFNPASSRGSYLLSNPSLLPTEKT
mmetsp:Transcript_58435/g.117335  ORF Transcript_58435/g.117335 Transcript_58435/m.117335 type:complete len:121 (+) Transcript_58435:1552-1914(+)